MQYFGGKARIAKPIAEWINAIRLPGQMYWEPFVGGANIISKVDDTGPRIGSDACGPLIDMYCKLQEGWQPPLHVSETDYALAKLGLCPSYEQAFIGFGCSFAGKWFGGFARGGHGADAKTASSSLAKKTGRNYAKNASSSLEKRAPGFQTARFEHYDYRTAPAVVGAIIYCDPPYAGTTGYKGAPPFNPAEFWLWAQRQEENNTVIVSEYNAPAEWSCICSFSVKTDIRGRSGQIPRTEKLFMRRS